MKAIGIDLGTTNSAAAVIDGKQSKVLPTRDGDPLTPSVVSYVKRKKNQEGEIVVGCQAYNNAVRDPVNTVFSIKRLMGRIYGEKTVIDQIHQRFGITVADAPPEDTEDQGVRVLLNEQPYTPVEISAMILKHIKEDAELALSEEVTHAVITVPAWFEERQRQATAAAGEAAGLKVLQIIDEPTAAAIAFGAGREQERHRVLVYDLGGGTFDISIIQMTSGQYTVMEIQGDNWLGGDDFDLVIVERLVSYIKEEYDFDASTDPALLSKLKVMAQTAKRALSSRTSVEILETYYPSGVEPLDIDLEISREEFEDDITPLVERTIEKVREALHNQNLTTEDITEVLMVGGSTAVPLVLEKVKEVFGGQKVKRQINPMECVALGAGILASHAQLEGDTTDISDDGPRVDQVTPMHLGISAVKGDNPDCFVSIIPRGTPYPMAKPKRRLFSPSSDNQNVIRVPVFEGLNPRASLNEQQGVIEFPLREGLDASSKIEVAFNYDQNRVLTVDVRVVGTEQSIHETLRRDRAQIKPGGNGQETLKDDWREDLQPAMDAARHFLETYSDELTEEERKGLEQAVAAGEQAFEIDVQTDGIQATNQLQHRIMTSGIASVLFMAERVMGAASPEQAQLLAQASGELREANRRRDRDRVKQLTTELRLATAQIISRQSGIREIHDKQDFEDLLRVTE